MSGFPAITLPPQLKVLSHCLKLGAEHESRDPVIAYWCRYHAVQVGLSIDKSSVEAKKALFALLDWLETRKNEMRDNEAISNDAVAEAHIENYVLKIFQWADSQDRASIFNKNVVKSFYTSGVLIDVLTNFNKGELSEEFQRIRKYAKWKAAYIHNCLKNGETPEPGPAAGGEDDDAGMGTGGYDFGPGPGSDPPNQQQFYQPPPAASTSQNSYGNIGQQQQPWAPGPSYQQPYQPEPVSQPLDIQAPPGPVPLRIQDIAKAQKYCKWASSALNFDDVPTAITNLENALRLLKTGVDTGEQ